MPQMTLSTKHSTCVKFENNFNSQNRNSIIHIHPPPDQLGHCKSYIHSASVHPKLLFAALEMVGPGRHELIKEAD